MRHLINKLITAFILIFISALTVLYSEGWRLNYLGAFMGESLNTDTQEEQAIRKTGMIAVRSIPDGAKVYIDNDLITATDDTITNLTPNKYKLKVEKEGFETWEKEINVYPDLVTDITAILVLQSPKLEPLTSLDVKTFALSNNQNNIVFTSANNTQPGLWILPLNRTGINLFRNETQLLAQDSPTLKPSLAKDLEWSIDDQSIITKNTDNTYTNYIFSNDRVLSTTNLKDITTLQTEKETEWQKDFLSSKQAILDEQKAPAFITQSLTKTFGTWAPDNEKFFLIQDKKLIVYNSETPLPVGEKRIYETVLNFNSETTSVNWYSDSYHFILVEKDPTQPDYYTISLVRIDGTNKTTVYSGKLASSKAYPSPSGDRIIVLTSLKENTTTNLYSIGLR